MEYARERRLDWTRLMGAGGMPSSHTAFVVGLTSAVGVKEGISSSLFAVCAVLTCVVMYDATGLRYHAGRQAIVLNMIGKHHPLSPTPPIKDHPSTTHPPTKHPPVHPPSLRFEAAFVMCALGVVLQLRKCHPSIRSRTQPHCTTSWGTRPSKS